MSFRPLGIRLTQNPSQRKEKCLARGEGSRSLLGGEEQGGHVFAPRGLSKLDARTKGSLRDRSIRSSYLCSLERTAGA